MQAKENSHGKLRPYANIPEVMSKESKNWLKKENYKWTQWISEGFFFPAPEAADTISSVSHSMYIHNML